MTISPQIEGHGRIPPASRAIDLEGVFEFPLARQARVEGLVVVVVEIPVALEKAAAGP